MKHLVQTLATGLGHPEGPDILSDGRIVMVETYTGKIIVWSAEEGIHDYAVCGGGPNACKLGSDGAIYITQNGGTVGAWRAENMIAPSIQRAWPDGSVEIVLTEIDGVKLQAPNDLSFGPDGSLFFTDPGDYFPENRGMGRIHMVGPDGSAETVEEMHGTYPNGIVAERGGSIVWVDSYERNIYRLIPGEKSQKIATLPENHVPDGLKIDIDGNLWITTFMGGGIDVLDHDGTYLKFIETGGVPLNCVFLGDSLIITDFGDVTGVTEEAPMGGRLWRVPVGVEGQPLFRGAIK
jgi:gluconolactonase